MHQAAPAYEVEVWCLFGSNKVPLSAFYFDQNIKQHSKPLHSLSYKQAKPLHRVVAVFFCFYFIIFIIKFNLY